MKLLGSNNFKFCLHSSDIQTNFSKLTKTPNLSNVFSKYHKLTNVFSKTKTEVLTFHCSYNLQINLEEDTQPLVGLIYSLSGSKQKAFKEFIEKNLNTGFIWLTFSPYSALVLFVKKKDGSLCFCVNFHSLNCIFKKDCYLLLLISNLLDSSCKAWIYSKIDLVINGRLLLEYIMDYLSGL